MPRLSISQSELLQLHLLEMEPYRVELEVPKEACQEGISSRMGSGLHNISRALSSMTAEGLVESRLCHVRGAPKRRKAYFLTEKGLLSTQSLVADLRSRSISLDDGRSVRTVTLFAAMQALEEKTGKKPNLLDLVVSAKGSDELNLQALTGLNRGDGSPTPLVTMSFGLPVVDLFVGREDELRELNEFIRPADASCALVVGLPGIGKSTLAARVFESHMDQRSSLWYKIHEWDSVQSVARILTGFFHSFREDRHFPEIDQDLEVADIYSPLVQSLRDLKPVIFLDDVDRATPSVSMLIGLLYDAVASSPPSKLVLISRSVPQFLASGSDNLRRMDIGCLDKETVHLLASRWEAHDPDKLAEESGGHPLMLRLACEAGAENARGSIDDLLGEHFQKVLSPNEKDALEFLSVVRLPIPARELPGPLPATVSSLKRKGLIQEYAEGIAVHQVVRAHFISKMSSEDAARMHRAAVSYCQERTGDRWRLEEISQEIATERWAKATDVLWENIEGLASGFVEESMSLASIIPAGRLELVSLARLAYVRGRLNRNLGMLREALGDFELSLSALREEPEGAMKALVQEAYAITLAEANMISESLEVHRRALSYYESEKDHAGQIREWMGIGSAWRRSRSLKEATEAFMIALRIARDRTNNAAVAANLNNLALLEWEGGDLRGAESHLKEAISVAATAGDAVGEGTGQANLADLYLIQLREKESENLRLESAETFRRAGDTIQYKRVRARWAIEISGRGREVEAIAALEGTIKAYGKALRPGRSNRSVTMDEGDLAILTALIELYRGSGDRESASRTVETFSKLAHELGRKDLEARASMEAALNEESSGDMTAALVQLKKAEVILRELGNNEGLGAVYLRSGMIHMENGERKEALADLRESARHAELSGNALAYSAALNELGEALGSVSAEGREYLEKARDIKRSGRIRPTGHP